MSEPRPSLLARDAYRASRVLVTSRGRAVAGFEVVRGLHRTTGVVEPVPGGAAPGRDELELARGVTGDAAFARWLVATRRLRRDLGIEVRDEAGRVVLGYRLLGARVLHADTMPLADGPRGGSVIELLRLELRGWERDPRIVEPIDPGEPVEPIDPGEPVEPREPDLR